jgi:ABC-2 type transport system permease protein
MTTDIVTVMWKEWKELLESQCSPRGGLLFLIVILAVFGIIFPLREGAGWAASPLPLLNAAWLPFFFLNGLVVDSFAGERERKTLETLLGTRLSDRAILFGKLGAAIAYGWGLTLLIAALALITVNVAARSDHWLLYSSTNALGILVLSLPGAGLAAGSGIFVSLRAPTVRQAYQQLTVMSLFFPALLVLGFLALPSELKAQAGQALIGASEVQILVVAGIVIVVVDIALMIAAVARFQRARLILD